MKWALLAGIVGVLAGLVSALFLLSLDFVTSLRVANPQLLYLLPLAGLLVVFIYQKYGRAVEHGTNLLLEELHEPNNTVPFRMAPLVLLGTLVTHLFGGSAGREGTAMQMGGSLADQLAHFGKLRVEDRRILLMCGIASGFASVFGTPIAGAIFGLEVLAVGRIRYQGLWACIVGAVVGHLTCLSCGVLHTHYPQILAPASTWSVWCATALSGVLFGACAWIFSWGGHHLSAIAKAFLKNPYLRIFCGGVMIVLLTVALATDRYLGLGLPVIVESFHEPARSYDFLLKMVFTLITLSAGFKGGEVTPLFFIGATLGSALSLLLPLPVGLLAAMGFVAVFAGAANTPIACLFLAVELFGSSAGLYMAVAIMISYFCSGHQGIYSAQRIEVRKDA